MPQIDLNSDIGEMEGDAGRALDAEILKTVTSCNIACGGHAGDDVSMAATLRLARDGDTLVGAHPSYPDKEGFGRRAMEMPLSELKQSLTDQVRALQTLAAAEGVSVRHVKPHGALYNEAAKSQPLSECICDVLIETGISVLFGPPNSKLETEAEKRGLRFLAEGFVDRAYEADGSLVSRSLPGAVHKDVSLMTDQAMALARSGEVNTLAGKRISLPVQTLCLHGDTSGAAEVARTVKAHLLDQGIEVKAYA